MRTWLRRLETTRGFARAFVGAVAGALALLAAANLIVDPHEVLGGGLLPVSVGANARYRSYLDYRRAGPSIDTVIMGSSRVAVAFTPMETIAALAPARVAVLHGTFGVMPDYLTWTRAVLADRAAGRNRLGHVVLVLDPDLIGYDTNDQSIASRHHPAVSGQNPIQFYSEALLGMPRRPFWIKLGTAFAARAQGAAITGLGGWANVVAAPITQRALTRAHVEQLREIVAMTRAAGVRVTVLLSPQHPLTVAALNADDMARARDWLAAVTPVWDFQGGPALSPDAWTDIAHYVPAIARAMLARALDLPIAAPAGFGRRYPLVP